MINVVIKV